MANYGVTLDNLVLDGGYKNYSLLNKIQLTPTQNADDARYRIYRTFISLQNLTNLPAIVTNGNWVTIYKVTAQGIELVCSSNEKIDVYIFSVDNNNLQENSNYGIRVFNESSLCVFDSRKIYLKPYNQMFPANFNGNGEMAVTPNIKTAIIPTSTSSRSFESNAIPDYSMSMVMVYYTEKYQFFNVNNNIIKFKYINTWNGSKIIDVRYGVDNYNEIDREVALNTYSFNSESSSFLLAEIK